MISRHVSVCCALTCALLAILVSGCAPAWAAPMGEPTTATQRSAELELSRIGYDLANTISVEFAAIKSQPYVSTEVDTEAEVAPTSLPMTNEEMALAEVAAVVAELATTAASELKVRDQVEDVAEKVSNSRNAEEDRQEVKARNLANIVEAMTDVTVNDDDFVAATTFRTNLPQQINTTPITTTMSPATSQPIVPATATESPPILDELVRAAAAANEILAAALNVATMAVTNIKATMATATGGAANLSSTVQPEATTSTASVVDHAQVSDNEMLPETTAWQPNYVERLATTTTATPDYSTTPSDVANKPTDNPNTPIKVIDDKLLDNELESIRQSQTVTPIQETTVESIEESTGATTTDLSQVNGLTNTDEEPKRSLAGMDNEASELMIIEKSKEFQETMDSPPPSRDNELENSTSDAENLVTNITDKVVTQTEPAAESATEEAPVIAEIEELKFEVVKKEQKGEGEENVPEQIIRTTTTESLETLIAVESEARVPIKIILISDLESLETTTTIPELTTIMSESILATNEATTTTNTAASTEADLLTKTTTETLSIAEPTTLITTTGAQEENIATTESDGIKIDGLSASEQSEISIKEASDKNQIIAITTEKLPVTEATTIFEEELSTSPLALTENYKEAAEVETTTDSIEEPITVTRIPFKANTFAQSSETTRTTTELLSTESSRSSNDTPSPLTITTLATEEIQNLEISANQANFEAFPNADLTEVSPQSTTQTTEEITTTIGSSTTTASVTQPPEIVDTVLDVTKFGSTAEIREQMPPTTEEVLSTTIITTEKMVEAEDTTIEEQPLHTIKEQQQQQQKLVMDENDSALTTANAIVTTKENTIEDADEINSAAALETASTTTADVTTVGTPEEEVTTTVATTTPEPDITTTTTTTTLSPMSLIVAEHEARSLDRTPPRVSRIVNEDGVEVLTGYSIVHHMHAAALAALAAEEA